MNDQDTQQLIYRSGRWPWRWFKLFRVAASIAEKERCKFNVLSSEHHLLKIEASELHKHRLDDAGQIHQLRDELQALKTEAVAVSKKATETAFELEKLKEERATLISTHKQMKDGVTTLFEFIRRNKINDDHGRQIPTMPLFPNIFRQ